MPEISPGLRARAYNVVAEQTERAQEVLEGKRAWTNQQVRLYGMLLNKVLPDLKHTFQEVHANKPEGMSREDLERIVAEAHAAERQAQQEDDD